MIDIEKPKYQKLKEYLTDKIRSQEWMTGDKICSENELAEQFSISRHTVRQAISELAADGWLYKVQGKGTFVDRRPDKQVASTKTIGVITTYLGDYIFPSIIRGIDSVLSMNGYNIILGCTYNQHEKEHTCLENMLNQRIDGLIVEPTKSALPNPNAYMYRELSNNSIPVLFIHGLYKELEYSYVLEDDVQAGYIAAKHLIDQGHRTLGCIFKMDDIQGHKRFQGYQQALKEAGLVLADSNVIWFDTENAETIFVGEGKKRLDTIFEKCSAIVCYNDQIALKVMDVIRSKEMSVPEDISLISFDDSQLAVASEVKLTTVAHPKEKLGEEAAKAIIQMAERSCNYFDIQIQPELVVRESVKNQKMEE